VARCGGRSPPRAQKSHSRPAERGNGNGDCAGARASGGERDTSRHMKTLNFSGLARILAVDDEEGIREGLPALLQNEGVAVETAAGADDARRRLALRGFDLVFLDLNLSGDDGLAVLPTLRTGVPPADVVILTGYGTVANTVEAMRKGAADVIEKPFTPDRILAVVRRCLEMRQLRNELNWLQERVRELTATELVGLSPAIRAVTTRIDQVAHA